LSGIDPNRIRPWDVQGHLGDQQRPLLEWPHSPVKTRTNRPDLVYPRTARRPSNRRHPARSRPALPLRRCMWRRLTRRYRHCRSVPMYFTVVSDQQRVIILFLFFWTNAPISMLLRHVSGRGCHARPHAPGAALSRVKRERSDLLRKIEDASGGFSSVGAGCRNMRAVELRMARASRSLPARVPLADQARRRISGLERPATAGARQYTVGWAVGCSRFRYYFERMSLPRSSGLRCRRYRPHRRESWRTYAQGAARRRLKTRPAARPEHGARGASVRPLSERRLLWRAYLLTVALKWLDMLFPVRISSKLT